MSWNHTNSFVHRVAQQHQDLKGSKPQLSERVNGSFQSLFTGEVFLGIMWKRLIVCDGQVSELALFFLDKWILPEKILGYMISLSLSLFLSHTHKHTHAYHSAAFFSFFLNQLSCRVEGTWPERE
jgi:hypothetical protein